MKIEANEFLKKEMTELQKLNNKKSLLKKEYGNKYNKIMEILAHKAFYNAYHLGKIATKEIMSNTVKDVIGYYDKFLKKCLQQAVDYDMLDKLVSKEYRPISIHSCKRFLEMKVDISDKEMDNILKSRKERKNSKKDKKIIDWSKMEEIAKRSLDRSFKER